MAVRSDTSLDPSLALVEFSMLYNYEIIGTIMHEKVKKGPTFDNFTLSNQPFLIKNRK